MEAQACEAEVELEVETETDLRRIAIIDHKIQETNKRDNGAD